MAGPTQKWHHAFKGATCGIQHQNTTALISGQYYFTRKLGSPNLHIAYNILCHIVFAITLAKKHEDCTIFPVNKSRKRKAPNIDVKRRRKPSTEHVNILFGIGSIGANGIRGPALIDSCFLAVGLFTISPDVVFAWNKKASGF